MMRAVFLPGRRIMSIEQFESWSLFLGIGGLIVWMLLIIWKMGRESQAGKYGFFVLFLALGLGFVGFLAKTILVEVLKL
jgi:heme exporter protein D